MSGEVALVDVERDVANFFAVVNERDEPPSSFIVQLRQLVENSKNSPRTMKAIHKELMVVMRETFSQAEKTRFQQLTSLDLQAADYESVDQMLKENRVSNETEFRLLLHFVGRSCSEGAADTPRVEHANRLLATFESTFLK